MTKPLVSITCITYNHAGYIATTLESFLMQKTNFNIEVLIHDDASTDNTANIIKIYQAKYPNIIKPIYQTDNQYSKGVKVGNFNLERIKGKYVTPCEGDDYWTDPYKLQTQVDYMEKNLNCSMCVHSAFNVSSNGHKMSKGIRPYTRSKTLNFVETILGGGGLFPTNSIMYRAEYASNRPEFFDIAPIGDYPLVIYLALKGEVYYIDKKMSAYRHNSKGSWTSKILRDKEMALKNNEKIILMFKSVDEYTCGKYSDVIELLIMKCRLEKYMISGDKEIKYKTIYDKIINNPYFKQLPTRSKIKITSGKYFPSLLNIVRDCRTVKNYLLEKINY